MRKRTPSSSENAITSSARLNRRSGNACAAAMPSSTPRMPSYLPASGTVSTCEPTTNTLASAVRPGSRPIMLPTASTRTRSPAAVIHVAQMIVNLPHRRAEKRPREPARLLAAHGERRRSGPVTSSRQHVQVHVAGHLRPIRAVEPAVRQVYHDRLHRSSNRSSVHNMRDTFAFT